MRHSADAVQDYRFRTLVDFGQTESHEFRCSDFYKKEDIVRKGFVHADGSLRLEFFIMKDDLKERIQLLREENQQLKAENQDFRAKQCASERIISKLENKLATYE